MNKAPFLAGVAIILAAMLIGPFLAPDGFDVWRHTTSEQAAQGLPGAWAMQTGFIAYGCGAVGSALLSVHMRPMLRLAISAFGLGLIGTTIWSNAPILGIEPADLAEDRLHSIASGVVGTSFAMVCATRLFDPGGNRRDGIAWMGLAISVLVPLAMAALPEVRGLLQRAMFLYSFAALHHLLRRHL